MIDAHKRKRCFRCEWFCKTGEDPYCLKGFKSPTMCGETFTALGNLPCDIDLRQKWNNLKELYDAYVAHGSDTDAARCLKQMNTIEETLARHSNIAGWRKPYL